MPANYEKECEKNKPMSQSVRIATRKSPLALWQAESVAALLRQKHTDLEVELVPMSTRGDEILDRSLAKIGGKGLFIKELEHAMQNGDADIAVHSMKDVPALLPDGFCIAAVLERENPDDALVGARSLNELPDGAKVGTSSLRRQCQLLAVRPDLDIQPLRGNVGTRLQRVADGDVDAAILAVAGLTRLGLADRIGQALPHDTCLPAIGQGIIGIECLSDNIETRGLVFALEYGPARFAAQAERAMGLALGGDCQSPIAGHAVIENDQLHIKGLVGTPDGSRIVTAEENGLCSEADIIGRQLGEKLLKIGAAEILDTLKAGKDNASDE